ncbi:MAG: antitoxin component of RelBE/YafQ-DinJ toxin-antitoxin module [Acidimicrobiales bacterium]|jgi:antitoxin component of RelBE/YafQ-DinJ toxin-antitoxin module
MKTVLNVKTDVEVKKKAQELAKHLGVPLSTVVNAYLKEFIYSGEFTLRAEPRLRPEVAKRIDKAMEESKDGKNLSPAFTTVEDFAKYLNS